MRKQQFDENVSRSLYQAARDLELKETYQLLKDSITKTDKTTNITKETDTAFRYTQLTKKNSLPYTFVEARLKRTKEDLDAEKLRKDVTNVLLHREGVLEEVINEILYIPSVHPLSERISSLDTDLKRELNNNGINLTYHSMLPTQTETQYINAQTLLQIQTEIPTDKYYFPMIQEQR